MPGNNLTYNEALQRHLAELQAKKNQRLARNARRRQNRTESTRETYKRNAIKLIKKMAKREYGIHLGEYNGAKFKAFLRDPMGLRKSLDFKLPGEKE